MDGFTKHHHDTTLHPRVPLCQAAQCWRGAGRVCEACDRRLCALHRNGRDGVRILCLPCYCERYDLYGRRKEGGVSLLAGLPREHALAP